VGSSHVWTQTLRRFRGIEAATGSLWLTALRRGAVRGAAFAAVFAAGFLRCFVVVTADAVLAINPMARANASRRTGRKEFLFINTFDAIEREPEKILYSGEQPESLFCNFPAASSNELF
jgi:hypothetical protein